jgi:hypothetical protein
LSSSEGEEGLESYLIPSHFKEEIIRINVGGYRYTTTKCATPSRSLRGLTGVTLECCEG